MSWAVEFTRQAVKDLELIKRNGLQGSVRKLIDMVKENPYQNPPPFEKLVGDLAGAYSRRINIKHRMVYMIDEPRHTVRIMRLWSHYE